LSVEHNLTKLAVIVTG